MFNRKYILNLSGTVGTTEKYNKEAVIEKIVDHCSNIGIDGFTLVDSVGAYKGAFEKSYVLEVLGTEEDYLKVAMLGYDLMIALEQEDIFLSVVDYSSISIADLFKEMG